MEILVLVIDHLVLAMKVDNDNETLTRLLRIFLCINTYTYTTLYLIYYIFTCTNIN